MAHIPTPRGSMAEFFAFITEYFSVFLSFVLHIDQHLFELVATYGKFTYGILFVIVFCETGLVVTPFLPGDSLLFAAGTLAGAGKLNLFWVMGSLLAAAVIGDAVNYHIGRYIGPPVFEKNYRFLNRKHLQQAHEFYERHGGKAIILARFVPVIRTFAPFVAGVAKMDASRFFLFNVTGALIWVCLLTPAGYALGNIPWVQRNFSLLVYAIILVSCLPIAVGVVKTWLTARRKKSNAPNE